MPRQIKACRTIVKPRGIKGVVAPYLIRKYKRSACVGYRYGYRVTDNDKYKVLVACETVQRGNTYRGKRVVVERKTACLKEVSYVVSISRQYKIAVVRYIVPRLPKQLDPPVQNGDRHA